MKDEIFHEPPPKKDENLTLVPILQALVLLACIVCVTILGYAGVIDAASVTAIIGAIVGSVGVLAGIGITNRRNGRGP